MRVARSRELVARGYALAAVARVLQVTRQAIYRTPKPRTAPQRRPASDPVDVAIVAVAKDNPTDGYRMVWALARRELGWAINRKRVLRVMREHELIQRRGRPPRRRRPGVFRVTRPVQLWHMDMTAVWVAEQGIAPGTLTLGTDNGSAFTARATRAVLSGLGVAHRRGGYRDPESQAFIESWFSKLKERLIWRMEFETLHQLRAELAAYIDRYHHRPHSGLDYRTPKEVRQTWDDAQQQLQKLAA